MLKIHFLNVGHGDCTIIEHPSGRLTMIDINNGDELDDTSQGEILSELNGATMPGPLGRPTLAGGLNPFASPTGALGGLFGLGAVSPGAGHRGLGAGLLSEANPFASALARVGALERSKMQALKSAGYEVALTNPVDFFLQRFLGRSVFRYIQSHPDLDHMRGLAGLRASGIGIINFWDTEHGKVPDFQSDSDRTEWAEYQRMRNGQAGVTRLTLTQGASGVYWNADPTGYGDHDSMEILSPTPEIVRSTNATGNSNNLSYVLRVSYAGVSVILGADAETEVWQALAAQYGRLLKCDVLKASHHGRDTGYCAEAVRLMAPTYTVVSVGKKPENDASNKYRAYCSNVWSTRWYGNLTLEVSPRGEIQWFAQHVK